jgi:hydrogenase expression/formation protein HypC
MCLAIPSRIVALDGLTATVECFGLTRACNLMLLGDEAKLGDYVLLQAGGYAYEIVDVQRAQEALTLMRQVLEAGGGAAPPAKAAA